MHNVRFEEPDEATILRRINDKEIKKNNQKKRRHKKNVRLKERKKERQKD